MTRQSQKPLVERAYELAQSGKFIGATEVKAQLKVEGYSATEIEGHLRGRTLRAAINGACKTSRSIPVEKLTSQNDL